MIIYVPELSIVLETWLLICFLFLAQSFCILLPTQFSFLLSEMPSTHLMVIFLISSLGYFITVAITVSHEDRQLSLSKLMNSDWLLHLKKKIIYLFVSGLSIWHVGPNSLTSSNPDPCIGSRES